MGTLKAVETVSLFVVGMVFTCIFVRCLDKIAEKMCCPCFQKLVSWKRGFTEAADQRRRRQALDAVAAVYSVPRPPRPAGTAASLGAAPSVTATTPLIPPATGPPSAPSAPPAYDGQGVPATGAVPTALNRQGELGGEPPAYRDVVEHPPSYEEVCKNL